jgi:hypothetical protein
LRGRLARAVLGLDALHRAPGLDQSARHRPRSDRSTVAPSPWAAPTAPLGTWPRCRLPAAGRGSSRKPNGPRLRRQRRFRRISGAVGCIPAAPSGSNKTACNSIARSSFSGGIDAAQSANRARQTRAPAPTAPRSQSSESLASPFGDRDRFARGRANGRDVEPGRHP